MFTAINLPSRPEGVEDSSRSGFTTEIEAEEYIFSQMCSKCKEEHRMALAGKHADDGDWPPDVYPACFYEWIVGPTKKVEKAKNFDQLTAACGWETVYRRGNTPEENERLKKKAAIRRKRD